LEEEDGITITDPWEIRESGTLQTTAEQGGARHPPSLQGLRIGRERFRLASGGFLAPTVREGKASRRAPGVIMQRATSRLSIKPPVRRKRRKKSGRELR